MSDKPQGEQIEMLAYWLALTNCAMEGDSKLEGEQFLFRDSYSRNPHIVQCDNYEEVIASCTTAAQSMMEGEEMWENFQAEVEMWRKEVATMTWTGIGNAWNEFKPLCAKLSALP